MKNNLLRNVATYWLGVETTAHIHVRATWRRRADDVRVVLLQANVKGQKRRLTLYRQPLGSWSPLAR